MKNKKHFTTIAKQILHRHQGVRNKQLTHPRRDWVIGLIAGFCVLLVCVVWSVYTYLEYRDRAVVEVEQSVTEVVVYRKSLVDKVLETYKQRELVHKQLLTEAAVPVVQVVAETGTSTIETALDSEEEPLIEVGQDEVDSEVDMVLEEVE